jgi:hypothetical protein
MLSITSAMSQFRSHAGTWIQRVSFTSTRASRVMPKRWDEVSWSETVPAEDDEVLFRLTAWPEIASDQRRRGWLPVVSAMSVAPFTFRRVLELVHQDAEAAADIFLTLMVAGYLEPMGGGWRETKGEQRWHRASSTPRTGPA